MKKSAVIALAVILAVITLLPVAMRWLVYPLRYEKTISRESRRNKVDPYLVAAVILQESHYDPGSVSSAGAVGLMQVMPDTASAVSTESGGKVSVAELKEPAKNIAIGVKYLAYLRKKYRDDRLALAAYNGGVGNVDSWLRETKHEGVDDLIDKIPFDETKNFVRAVTESRGRYEMLYPEAFGTPE